MLRKIFQIALCHGQLTLPEPSSIPSKKMDSVTNKKIYFDSSDSDEEEEEEEKLVIKHPNENEIFQAFKEQIDSLKMITFNFLFRIEQRLCEKFQVKNFHELGHGSFMNYIQQNEQLLFPMDAKFNFSSSESNEIHPTAAIIPFEDLEQFILQALDRSIDQQYIEQIICYHFQIESFEQLGHGLYRSVLNIIQQNKKSKNTSIHYECMMFDEIPLIKSKSILQGMRYYFRKYSYEIYLFRPRKTSSTCY